MITEVRLEQPENVEDIMRSMPVGITIEVRLEQLANADSPIAITLFGIEISRLTQPENARSPIVLTLFGMVTDVKSEQSIKARSPIRRISLGTAVLLQPMIKVLVSVSMTALHPFLESYFEFL